MAKIDYLIVGAGLFGSTFARLVTERGATCLVVERRQKVGGNLRCENIEGINVHRYGAHIFHTSDENVWRFMNRFYAFNDFQNHPLAIKDGKMYNLPINMHTLYQILGAQNPEAGKMMLDMETRKYRNAPITNLEEQALSMVGVSIYQTLIKGYTEKQWGMDCTKLPADIIKRIPVRYTFNNNYFNDKYQGVPMGGYNDGIEKMLVHIPVICDMENREIRQLIESKCAEHVIYTGAIDEFFDYSNGELKWRSVTFQDNVLNVPDFQGNAVVNNCDRYTPYTRIIEHKHFECLTQDEVNVNPKTVISYEFPREWKRGVEPYYPVRDDESLRRLGKYQEMAKEKYPEVEFCGRLGEYQYYDMDDTVAAAMRLVDKMEIHKEN